MVDAMDHINVRHYGCIAGKFPIEDGSEITQWPRFIEIDSVEPDPGYHSKDRLESGDIFVMECEQCTTRIQMELCP